MDVVGGKHVLVERPSDRRGKYVRIVQGIPVRVPMQHVEERVEVVCRLVDVHYKDGLIRAEARSHGSDSRPYGSERVLTLRRSEIGNDDGFVARAESYLSDRLFEVRERQGGAVRRQF